MKIERNRKTLVFGRVQFYLSSSIQHKKEGDERESEKMLLSLRGFVHCLGALGIISRRYELLICAQPFNEMTLSHAKFIFKEFFTMGYNSINNGTESDLEILFRQIMDGVSVDDLDFDRLF
ncbi:MAG: hypothetical protein Q4A17_12170 [Thermoguttaceae bacterium]|nr:hypothetical protein [Thermoguttaceae bacterium]